MNTCWNDSCGFHNTKTDASTLKEEHTQVVNFISINLIFSCFGVLTCVPWKFTHLYNSKLIFCSFAILTWAPSKFINLCNSNLLFCSFGISTWVPSKFIKDRGGYGIKSACHHFFNHIKPNYI